MQLIDGKVVLGLRECWNCYGTLRVNDWVTCTACKGTGKLDPRKPKGRNCKVCGSSSYAKGKVLALNCKDCYCTTTATPGKQAENICDTVPKEWIDALEIKVYRSTRPQGISENLFGSGLFGCVDYGRWQNRTDEELIADVRWSAIHVQAVKITRESDMQLCSSIGVFCNDGGYSVMPVFEDAQAVEEQLKRQLTYDEGMYVGTKLVAEGLPGSLMVKDYLK